MNIVEVVLAGLALGAMCALWMAVQRLVARVHPDAPGAVRKCGNCGCGGGACRRGADEHREDRTGPG